MSINYPSFPKTINSNKINVSEISASQITSSYFTGSFSGDGSGLINVIGTGGVLTDNINITGSGIFGDVIELKNDISIVSITASLLGNATTANFATQADTASIATTALTSEYSTNSEYSQTASIIITGSVQQVSAIKVNSTTFGFDSLNIPGGTLPFPPYTTLPSINLVRLISGSNYNTNYFGDAFAIGTSGSVTGAFIYSDNTVEITGKNLFINAVSSSTIGNIVITGSITSSNGSYLNLEIVQLRAQAILPVGSLGMLAVSGSDLYFHNGSSWVLK